MSSSTLGRTRAAVGFFLILAGLAAVPSGAATLADLLPTNISISGSPVNAGSSITVSYRVTNQGGTNAVGTQTKIQIKSSSNVLVTAPTFSTAAVNANSFVSENRSVTIPAGTAAGTYFAYVIVDNQSQVTQSNYSNDASSGTSFTVQSAASIPGAPQNLSGSSGNGQVGLSWNAPSSNGGASITSYRVFRGSSSSNTLIVTSGGCANLGNVTSCTDTGLTNGQSYYYIVSAVNSVGQGPPSNGVTVTPAASTSIPSAPRNLSASAGNGQVGLAWTAPSSNGGASITSYRVFRGSSSSNTLIVTSGGCASLGNVLSCTDTGLTNGQSYYYIVSAVNSVGQGPPSNGVTATPAGAASPADLFPQNISISGSPVSPGGSITVNYTITNAGGTNAPQSQTKIQIKNASNVQVTAPTFTTVPINANSSTTESRQVTIPAGSAAGIYNAYVIVDNLTQVTQSNYSNDLSAAYAFSVQSGTSIPGAPQNLSAASGNGQVGLAWNAPASNGGATITSYRVFRGSSSSNTLIVTSGGCANLGAVTSCTDTGLTNGQSYYYIVSAVNSVGQGPPSNGVTVTPAASTSIPGAPQNLNASAGNGQVGLAWNAPSSNGGASITSYRVFRGSSSSNTLIVTSGGCASLGNVLSCTDTGLTNGQSYYYIVSAVNSVGQGPPSNGVTATPAGTASPADLFPQNISISGSPVNPGGSITVNYTITNAGGTNAPQSQTKIQIKNSSNVQVTAPTFTTVPINANSSTTENRQVTIPAGSAAGTYNAYVIVDNLTQVTQSNYSNDLSAGYAFAVQSGTSIPGAPQNLSAASGNGQAGLAWNAPSSNGGATITSYRVFRGSSSSNTLIVTSGGCANLGAVTSCTDTGLTNGQSYYYIVSAVNSVGQGPPSNGVTVTPAASTSIPGAPRTLNASAGNGQVGLAWTAPSSNGGASITSYRVFRGSSSSNTLIVTGGGCGNLGAVLACTDTGLTNGQSYYYIVSAVNSVGQGPPSNGVTATPAGTASPADLFPQNISIGGSPVTPGGSITVNYTIRNSGGTNAPQSQTKIVIRDASGAQVTAPTFTSASVSANSSIAESRQVAIPAGSAAGTYNAYVIVDNLTQVTQSNYSNDLSAAVPFVVQTTGGTKPGTFSLSGSAYCTTAGTRSVALSWTASNGAASYTVLRDGFPLAGASNLPLSQLSFDDPNVAGGVTYGYVVRATNSSGSTDSSPINVLIPSSSCSTPLQAPSLLEPGSNSEPGVTISSPTPALRWSAPGGADGYSVTIEQRQSNGAYSAILTTDSLILGTSYTVPSGRLTDGTYRWSARSHGSSGFTAPSSPLYFKVAQSQQTCSLSCRATVPAGAGVNAPVSFSAVVDTTCGGTPVVQWTFGDAGAGATTALAGYTYKRSGTFPWSLTVTQAGQTCSRSGSIEIASAAVPVISGIVYDKTTSQPVRSAAVVIGSWQTTSGDNGRYEIRNVAAGEHAAMVSRSGYVTLNDTVSISASSAGTNQDFALQPVPSPVSPPTILSIGFPYKKFVHFLDGRSNVQPVKVTVGWSNHPAGVVWFRPSKAAAFSVGTAETVTRSFDMGKDFGNCGKLSIDAMSLDGAASKQVKAPFIVMGDPMPWIPGINALYRLVDSGGNFYYSASLGVDFPTLKEKSKGIDIPEWLPYFGKETLAMRLAPTIEASIGSDGSAEYDLSTNGLFTKKPKLAKPFLRMAGLDWSFDPNLHIDGQYLDSQCKWRLSGQFGLTGSLELDPKPKYIVLYGVPLYLKAKLAAEPKGYLVISGSDSGVDFSGRLELGLRARLSGGVGFYEILSGEIYVEGDGSAAWLPGASPWYEFAAHIKIGAELHLWVWRPGIGLYEWRWQYPENNAVFAPIEATSSTPRLLSREYLMRPNYAMFVGNRHTDQLASAATPSRVRVNEVQKNVFPFSQPSMAAAGDKVALLWLHDDPQRTSVNRTVAVFSSGTPDALDAPRPIADDGTADFHPRVVAFDDGTAFATWENANRTFDDNALPEQMSASMEIATAAYNPATRQWSAADAMTHNGYLDYSPRLAGREAGNLLLVWIANQSSDLTGSPGKPNELWFSRRTPSAWSTPQKFATISNAICRYDVAYDGNTAQVVMSVDTDGNLETVDDHELYLIRYDGSSWSAPQRLTQDAIADDMPSIAIVPNGRVLVWLHGDDLVAARDFDTSQRTTIASPGYSSTVASYRLASNASGALAIVWSDASNHRSDLFVIRYDAAVRAWGPAEKLTDDEETEKYAAPAMNANGDLFVVCDRGAVQQVGTVFASDAIVQPETDLALVLQRTATDLALSSVDVSPSAPQPGSIATLTASVANRGSVGIDRATVVFYSGSVRPDTVIATTQLPVALAPGAAAEVTVDWMTPAALPGTIVAVIDPDHLLPDANLSNNTMSAALALPDLTIDSIQYEVRGDSIVIAARVANAGNAASPATAASVRRDAPNGPLIESQTIPALGAGASIDLTATITGATPRDVYIAVDEPNAIAEGDETNNVRHFEIVAESTNGRRRSSPPPPCTSGLLHFSTISGNVAAAGERLQISVTADSPDCAWSATTTVPWIQVVSGATGKGSGVVVFDVASNAGSSQRSGSVVIAGVGFVIVQAGLSRDVTITLPGGVTMTLVRVSAGSFTMGSPGGERGRSTSETAHRVTITRDFLIGKYEVTEQQWNALMNSGSARALPQVGISWLDVAGVNGFLERLNSYLSLSGQGSAGTARLPTEAEWEYAARAGSQTRFPWGDALECGDDCSACPALDGYLWWCANASARREVGTRSPNDTGVYDMNGNVFEWVNDWSSGFTTSAVTDPIGPATGTQRIIRGGSFVAKTNECRSAQRWGAEPTYVSGATGVRIAMTLR